MIVGLVGICTVPWYLLEHYLIYLPIVSAFLAPLSGIMIVDYFVVRGTELDIKDLGTKKGEYYYNNGYNYAAIISYGVSGLIGIVFLKYSWLVSLPLASTIYYFFMKIAPRIQCKDN